MADLPILFSAPMVRAILREIERPGTGKTQTRRVINPQPFGDGYFDGDVDCTVVPAQAQFAKCFRFDAQAVGGGAVRTQTFEPRYNDGDRLYIREAIGRRPASFFGIEATNGVENAFYVADDAEVLNEHGFNICPWWKRAQANPAMHMPRWASRITLIITDVRVQRLQEISEADAIAEGMTPDPVSGRYFCGMDEVGPVTAKSAITAFGWLWNGINGKRPGCHWQDNPWVAAYTFRPILGNIDQVRL